MQKNDYKPQITRNQWSVFGQKPSAGEVRSSFTHGAPPWESSEFMNPADPEDLLLQYGKTCAKKMSSIDCLSHSSSVINCDNNWNV